MTETSTAARRRLARNRARLIGASMSQKPSAAEASTGPNTRAAARAKARTPDSAAHGSRPRAV